MQPHQERIIKEKEELDEKLKKLCDFKYTEIYKSLDPIDKELLLEQQDAMLDYSEVLGKRIQRFN